MKTNLLPLSSLVAAVFLATCCRGQSNVVFYGANTNMIAVSFVDTNLLSVAQTAIVSDIRLCLHEWGTRSELDLGPYESEFVGYLHNPDRSPHYPEGIKFSKNIISNETSGLALQIPKSLSDVYTNALAFAAANSNIVAAAYEFVAFVSSSNFVSISSNALPNYIMFKNGLPDANAESNAIVNLAPQIIPDIRAQTYYRPSILGFYYSPDGPAATNLWMQVPCSIPTGWGPLGWNGSTVLWHDGKWRFCIWADWVP